ncbi:hypothetical protein LTR53_008241 [Teratosphaeriaceae sp. CCFEE 6253]|nr:hypothetical protein LTR53_008241 [Teratosphaeriaceae sp. CCFEE 6253]
MADNDSDSHVDSPPSDAEDVATAAGQIINSASLSPPDSQHHNPADMLAGPNSNGKRPLNTISNGMEEVIDLAGAADETTERKGKARAVVQDFPPRTHGASGYTWSKLEDEPGYAWLNKKALDERQRAWEGMAHKDNMVKTDKDTSKILLADDPRDSPKNERQFSKFTSLQPLAMVKGRSTPPGAHVNSPDPRLSAFTAAERDWDTRDPANERGNRSDHSGNDGRFVGWLQGQPGARPDLQTAGYRYEDADDDERLARELDAMLNSGNSRSAHDPGLSRANGARRPDGRAHEGDGIFAHQPAFLAGTGSL